MTEIKEDKERNMLNAIIIKLSIGKMLMFPNLIYGFIAIPSKIPESFFVDIDNLILKLI